MVAEVDNIDIVIRSCGERTTPLLLETVNRLLPLSEVHVVRTRPFFKAIVETLSFARESSAPFILALDGDLILDERAPELLRACTQTHDRTGTLQVLFKIQDKFLSAQESGNRFYNNRYSAELYDFFVTDADPYVRYPEGNNLDKFAKIRGLNKVLHIEEIIGKHGYEQYYHNIYQSMFNKTARNFAFKEGPWRNGFRFEPSFLRKMRRKRMFRNKLEALVKDHPDDFDYRVALAGFIAGLRAKDVVLDSDKYADITEFLKRHGVSEKSPLTVP